MPYIEDVQCIWMIPNRWPDGTPIGLRNKLDRSQKWPFMVCKSVYAMSELHIKHHSSVKWPITEVIDTSTCINVTVYSLTEHQLVDYLTAIAFRVQYNIGDLADRNFMIKEDRVYSVDEEVTQHKVNLLTSFKPKKYNYVKQQYIKNKHMLSSWVTTILDKEFTLIPV